VNVNEQMSVRPVVTLPMYDLPEVRAATSEVLNAIASGLTNAGWPVDGVFGEFADHPALISHWRQPNLALSQSCGLPYVEELGGWVQIVGTFQWRGVSDERGGYRSVVVVRNDDPRSILDLQDATPVVNNPESLSGWCSLGATLSDAGYQPDDLRPYLVTGSHVGSIAAVASGVGDFAAIDAATFRLLERYRSKALANIRVVGVGPRIPATPLVTCSAAALTIEQIQTAVAAAIDGSDMSGVRDALGIDRFIPMEHSDYSGIDDLVEAANRILTRTERTVGEKVGRG
jgi:ABC-type phosphate/phosphonate transport system substrate-binding protein